MCDQSISRRYIYRFILLFQFRYAISNFILHRKVTKQNLRAHRPSKLYAQGFTTFYNGLQPYYKSTMLFYCQFRIIHYSIQERIAMHKMHFMHYAAFEQPSFSTLNNTVTAHPIGAYCQYFTRFRHFFLKRGWPRWRPVTL